MLRLPSGIAGKPLQFTLAFVVLTITNAQTQPSALQTLYSFTGGVNGANPGAGLVFGTSSLFGTTPYGGTQGYGTAFELTPGAAWTESVIYSFHGGKDGANPGAALTPGTGGVFYGTTFAGGSSGNGTVFQLTPPAKTGGAWTETVLYSFSGGTDGSGPQGGVARFLNGALFGTTFGGGSGAAGTVFELAPSAGGVGPWTETVIYNFQGGEDGSGPESGVILNQGKLYGTACCGTPGGTVFKLTPSGSGTWLKQNIFVFSAYDIGAFPFGNLTIDSSGILYGTTTAGGASSGGVVFSLTPGTQGKPYTLGTIHSFTNGTDGGAPYGALALSSKGVLYATVTVGCSYGNGGVLEFAPPAHGTGPWTETVLYSFMGTTDGSSPYAGVILGPNNALYGTTTFGGSSGPEGYGTAFELSL